MTNTINAATAATEPCEKPTASPERHLPGDPSLWFFIIGDLVIFGLYFVAYVIYRGLNQELFLEGQQHLSQSVGVINTVVLLTSSLFVALGTEAARKQKSREAFNLFGIAIAIGAAFPILKMIEWVPKVLAGLTPGENLFFMFYYVMTGLHLFHVLLGLVIMGFVMAELRKSSKPDMGFIETGGVYWHMVDLLWLVIFALFYVMR